MKIRAAAAVVAVILSAAATSASAAPSCNVISDAAGDAQVLVTAAPSDDSVDIISGDIASDKNLLTAAIRVKKLAPSNPQAPTGQMYFLLFTAPGSADVMFVSAGLFPTGNEFSYGYQGVDPNTGVNTSYRLGDAIGVVDTDKSELRLSVPIGKFAERANLKPGTKLSGLLAEGRKLYGQRVVPSQQVGPARAPLGGVTLTFDSGEGKSYVTGTPSCLAVGK